MNMYKDSYLSRFMTPTLSFANPPEGAVFVPQYGDVKPHCGHTLMLLLLQNYYSMQELRFLCRGYNRALLHMGFRIRESDLTPKQSVNDLMNQGITAMLKQADIGEYSSRVKVDDGKGVELEWAKEKTKVGNNAA